MVARYSWKFTVTMATGLGWSIYWIARDPPGLWAIAGMVVLCYFLTDLLSGMLHIILDNPRSLDIPFIKPLAEGFQAHHEDPSGIFKMGLYEHLYVMHLPLTLFFIATLPLHTPLVYVAYVTMVGMLHLMQMSHRWAHVPPATRPRVVSGMQTMRFIIRKSEHDQHHRPPFQRDFCIMSGVCNAPLNGIVRLCGSTSHLWILVFLTTCLVPLGIGFAVSRAAGL